MGIRERETGVCRQKLILSRKKRENIQTPDVHWRMAFTLPLEADDNEVAVTIANNFFGWD
jgi:hypothetical protein